MRLLRILAGLKLPQSDDEDIMQRRTLLHISPFGLAARAAHAARIPRWPSGAQCCCQGLEAAGHCVELTVGPRLHAAACATL